MSGSNLLNYEKQCWRDGPLDVPGAEVDHHQPEGLADGFGGIGVNFFLADGGFGVRVSSFAD